MPRETALIFNQVQRFLFDRTRLGISAFAIDEVLRGLMPQGSTSFPHAVGLASTWKYWPECAALARLYAYGTI